MRKILIVVIGLLTGVSAHGQTIEDFFVGHNHPVVWLGIDFSQVQLVGDFSHFGGHGSKDPGDLQSEYFPSWNRLLMNEPEKYDLKEFFRRRDLDVNINIVMERNDMADTDKMLTYSPKYFRKDDIREIIESYDLEGEEGLGLLFIAESLNKIDTEAYFHVVILNMSTKEVLLSERLRGQPSGFGIRNYWAGAIYEILKNIDSRYYRLWRSKYM